MIKLTAKLKAWLIENHGVSKDASDDEFMTAAGKAMFAADETKRLTPELVTDLTKTPEDEQSGLLLKTMQSIEKLLQGDKQTGDDGASADGKVEESKETESKETETETKAATTQTKAQPTALEKKLVAIGMSSKDEDGVEIRVKDAVERYDDTKTALCYPKATQNGRPHTMAGQPVKYVDKTLNEPTDRDKALAGIWAKYQILSVTPKLAGSPDRAWEKMSDHEKALLGYLAEESMWDDSKDGRARTCKGYKGDSGRGIKALIDDSSSGGLEAAPIVFDDMVIQTPLLHGELFPKVTVVPIDRGRRIEGVSTGTVTGSWGGVDDTSIGLFTTTSYVSAFDTTIFRWEGSIRIGLDFISDTPIDFGAHITAQYGERLLEDLDDVVADGNGSTQPEGVMNKSGVGTVSFGASESLALYEQLRFGVAKAEFRPNVKDSAVFCSTETSYRRARALSVGGSDARRLGGMDYGSYMWMEHPYAINESMDNSEIFFAIMARYRMYRRRGLAIRTSTEGDTLLRRNEMLIVAMARYGGQLERAACAQLTTTATA